MLKCATIRQIAIREIVGLQDMRRFYVSTHTICPISPPQRPPLAENFTLGRNQATPLFLWVSWRTCADSRRSRCHDTGPFGPYRPRICRVSYVFDGRPINPSLSPRIRAMRFPPDRRGFSRSPEYHDRPPADPGRLSLGASARRGSI